MDQILQDRTERYRLKSAEKVKATDLERKEFELSQRIKEIEEREAKAKSVLDWQEEARRDPVTAWRKAGMDPTQIIKMIASEATPEAETAHYLNELKQRVEAHETKLQEYIRLQEEAKQQAQIQEMNKQAKAGFDHFYGSDDCKSAKMIWGRDEFETICRNYADSYIKETGQQICPWSVLIPKVEAMAKTKLESIAKMLNPSIEKEEPVGKGKPVKTISSQTNQRFSGVKDISKMTDQERRDYLIAAAKAAKK